MTPERQEIAWIFQVGANFWIRLNTYGLVDGHFRQLTTSKPLKLYKI